MKRGGSGLEACACVWLGEAVVEDGVRESGAHEVKKAISKPTLRKVYLAIINKYL